MLNCCNLLSLSRAFLALCFLQTGTSMRLLALLAAMLSDFLDGFLARKFFTTTKLGEFLDPCMDKIFITIAGGILYTENVLSTIGLLLILSRDFLLCIIAIYLFVVQGWKTYTYKALFWGKVTTTVQFLVLIGLVSRIPGITYTFFIFVPLAFIAFFERLIDYKNKRISKVDRSI